MHIQYEEKFFSYLRIYTDVQMIQNQYSHHVESAVTLPVNLNASPLYIDVEVEIAEYIYESVETLYISSESDLSEFETKLAFLIRYSRWQPDALEPGPFRELLWSGNHLRPGKARALLHDFATWDERARELQDVGFYRNYCTLRKVLTKLSKIVDSDDRVCIAEITTQRGYSPNPDVLEHSFRDRVIDFGEPLALDESATNKSCPNGPYFDSAHI